MDTIRPFPDSIPKEKFSHVGVDEQVMQTIVRPSMTYWQDAWRRLKSNSTAMIALGFLVFITLMAIVGPFMTKYDYSTNYLEYINMPPSNDHWFGTDYLGRDLWARVWIGARVSLFIGFSAAMIQTLIGIGIGGIAGILGGRVDMLIMRTIDILIAIPYMIVVILIMVLVGQGLAPILLALTITGWLQTARLVRGQILQLKNQEFVLAAQALGASKSRLLIKHLIPNTMGLIIVDLTMSIPRSIFSEAFLSFIGIGITPPLTSWGQLANLGVKVLQLYPYQLLIPGVMISLTMLSLNIFGDGLRDALDPKMRR